MLVLRSLKFHTNFVYNLSIFQRPQKKYNDYNKPYSENDWISNATTMKMHQNNQKNIQMFIFKSLLLKDIKDLNEGKTQIQLTNKKMQAVIGPFYKPLNYSEISNNILKIQQDQPNFQEILKEQIKTYFNNLMTQTINVKDFLNILRTLQLLDNQEEYYQSMAQKIKEFLSEDKNLQVSAYYIVHFFVFTRNLSGLSIDDQINVQMFKNLLLAQNFKSLQLNHLFTIVTLENFPKMKNLYGYTQYSQSLQMHNIAFCEFLKTKLSQTELFEADSKVLSSSDFYINLIRYLKSKGIHGVSIYQLIEDVFLKQHFSEMKIKNIKLLNVVFNILAPTGAGEKLIKLQMKFFERFPKEYLEFNRSINFGVSISSVNWIVAYELSQAEKSLRQSTTNDYILRNEEFQQIKMKILNSEYFPLIESYLSMEYIDHKFQQFLLSYKENPVYMQSTYYQIQTLVELYKHDERYVQIYNKLMDFLQQTSSESLTNLLSPQSNEMNTEIEDLLITMKLQFEKEYLIFPRRVDYFIKSMNLILEADGEIHFKNDTEGTTQQQMRNLYYLLKGYRMLVIPSVIWEFHRLNGTTESFFRSRIQYLIDNPEVVFLQ